MNKLSIEEDREEESVRKEEKRKERIEFGTKERESVEQEGNNEG